MEKRYQVFVSSTFNDLQEERKEVMQALLELDCIPCGMELFPASNEDQWTLIKRMIDDCDYYILILGGRYGSIGEDGIGYTEKEYRYALKIDKPILAFVHENIDDLPSKFTEIDPIMREKLQHFRDLVEKKMRRTWSNAIQLGGVVSRSMIQQIKNFPAIGWVKADIILSEELSNQLVELSKENKQLNKLIDEYKIKTQIQNEQYAQGDDIIDLEYSFKRYERFTPRHGYNEISTHIVKYSITWNSLFEIVGDDMLTYGASGIDMQGLLRLLSIKLERKAIKKAELDNIDLIDNLHKFDNYENISSIFSILRQFSILGYIEFFTYRTNENVKLTELGLKKYYELFGIKKTCTSLC